MGTRSRRASLNLCLEIALKRDQLGGEKGRKSGREMGVGGQGKAQQPHVSGVPPLPPAHTPCSSLRTPCLPREERAPSGPSHSHTANPWAWVDPGVKASTQDTNCPTPRILMSPWYFYRRRTYLWRFLPKKSELLHWNF